MLKLDRERIFDRENSVEFGLEPRIKSKKLEDLVLINKEGMNTLEVIERVEEGISKEGIKRDLYWNKGIPKEETERILTKLKQKGILRG